MAGLTDEAELALLPHARQLDGVVLPVGSA
jgi:hypothetical protein